MKNLTYKTASLTLALALLLGGAAAALASATTLRVVQTPSIHLYAGLSAVATTARISPYPKDLDGTKLTITDFGSTPTFTVDPKVLNVEEIISFTAIVDNGDNTATLTGLSRNLVSKYPYTTAGTGRAHGSGATVVFGNNPQIYGRLGSLENDQTWTGISKFTISPILDDTNSTSTKQAASRAYANGLVAAGVATSSETNFGGIWLATKLQQASSTNGAPNAPYVLQSKNSTSTYNGGTAGGNGLNVVVTRNNNTIDPNFIATSSTDNYTFGGTMTYSGINNFTSKFGVSSSSPYTNFGVASPLPAIFGTINATSTVANAPGNATSSFDGNLNVGGNASTSRLTVSSGGCIGCISGYETINQSGALNGGSPSTVTITASCSAGKRVLSGGYDIRNAGATNCPNQPVYNEAASSSAGWIASFSCGNGRTDTLYVFAYCANQ